MECTLELIEQAKGSLSNKGYGKGSNFTTNSVANLMAEFAAETCSNNEDIKSHVVNCGTPQLCPKCNGQGTVSKPPWVAGDVHKWVSSEASFTCDLCNGAKIIPFVLVGSK